MRCRVPGVRKVESIGEFKELYDDEEEGGAGSYSEGEVALPLTVSPAPELSEAEIDLGTQYIGTQAIVQTLCY